LLLKHVGSRRPGLRRLREQLERLDVRGAQDAEVPVIECRELALAEPLDESENARVDNPERLVVVLNLDLVAARQIDRRDTQGRGVWRRRLGARRFSAAC
jgi:hypothetical protein